MAENAQLTAIILAINNLVQMVENMVGAGAGADDVGNVKWKDSARAVATTNITLEDEQTIDTIAVVADDIVLAAGQTDPAENGLYVVVDEGPWVRASNADTWIKLYAAMVVIEEGDTNADAVFLCTANTRTGVLGTTALPWIQIG